MSDNNVADGFPCPTSQSLTTNSRAEFDVNNFPGGALRAIESEAAGRGCRRPRRALRARICQTVKGILSAAHQRRVACLQSFGVRTDRREVLARRSASQAHAGVIRDARGDRLPATILAFTRQRGAWCQCQRRDSHSRNSWLNRRGRY